MGSCWWVPGSPDTPRIPGSQPTGGAGVPSFPVWSNCEFTADGVKRDFPEKVQAETQLHLCLTPPHSPGFPTDLSFGHLMILFRTCVTVTGTVCPQDVLSAATLTSPPHPFRPALYPQSPSAHLPQPCPCSFWPGAGSNASHGKRVCVLEDLPREGHTLHMELYRSCARFIGQGLKSHWTAGMDPCPSTHQSV